MYKQLSLCCKGGYICKSPKEKVGFMEEVIVLSNEEVKFDMAGKPGMLYMLKIDRF